MKKYFLLGLIAAIAPSVCFGAGARYTQLVREKQRKMAELEKCMGATSGLKIAGLSTIGLTTVGVAGNIAEAKKLDEYDTNLKLADKKIATAEANIEIEQQKLKDIEDTKKKAEEDAKKKAEEAKKAELEYNLYQVNCRLSGGVIADDTCWCSQNKQPDSTGKCVRNETKGEKDDTLSKQPTVDGQILTGVVSGNDTSSAPSSPPPHRQQ